MRSLSENTCTNCGLKTLPLWSCTNPFHPGLNMWLCKDCRKVTLAEYHEHIKKGTCTMSEDTLRMLLEKRADISSKMIFDILIHEINRNFDDDDEIYDKFHFGLSVIISSMSVFVENCVSDQDGKEAIYKEVFEKVILASRKMDKSI